MVLDARVSEWRNNSQEMQTEIRTDVPNAKIPSNALRRNNQPNCPTLSDTMPRTTTNDITCWEKRNQHNPSKWHLSKHATHGSRAPNNKLRRGIQPIITLWCQDKALWFTIIIVLFAAHHKNWNPNVNPTTQMTDMCNQWSSKDIWMQCNHWHWNTPHMTNNCIRKKTKTVHKKTTKKTSHQLKSLHDTFAIMSRNGKK